MTHPRRKTPTFFKIVCTLQTFFLTVFLVIPPNLVQAQTFNVLSLPAPGSLVNVSESFMPVLLKGISLHPENPLVFDFIVDPGNSGYGDDQIKAEGERLIKYFLAALTVPEKDLWVNLSPYDKDRIIPAAFGQTEMGRDLLAQDYILKQISASMIYPERDLGKDFWGRVYQKAKEVYGTVKIPVSTFNKVWVVPDKAVIVENEQTAYVAQGRLKVMLEEDYAALDQNRAQEILGVRELREHDLKKFNSISSAVVREIILPEIEKEVNEGKNFAQLRQIYYSLVLAAWFKNNLKDNILNQVYADQKKISGVDIDDKNAKEKIYERYMEAYRQGVFNYIREDVEASTQERIPRKYFSGGANFADSYKQSQLMTPGQAAMNVASGRLPASNFQSPDPRNPQRTMMVRLDQAGNRRPISMEQRSDNAILSDMGNYGLVINDLPGATRQNLLEMAGKALSLDNTAGMRSAGAQAILYASRESVKAADIESKIPEALSIAVDDLELPDRQVAAAYALQAAARNNFPISPDVMTRVNQITSRPIDTTASDVQLPKETLTADTFRALSTGLNTQPAQAMPRVEPLVSSGVESADREVAFEAALTALNPRSPVSEPLKMRAVKIVTDRITTGTPQEKARASEAVLRVPTVFEQPVQTAATEFVARQMEPAREVTRPVAPTVDALRAVNTGLNNGIMPAGSVEPMVRSGLESPNTDVRLQAARAALNPAQVSPQTRTTAIEVIRDALTQGIPEQQAEAGRIVLERPEAFTNVAAGNNNRPIEAVAREAMSSQVREAVRPDMAQAPTREALQALEVGAKDQQLRLQMPTGSIEPMVRSGLESPDNGLRMQAARTALSPNVQVAPEVKTRAVEIVTRELKQGTPQQQAEAGDVVLARPEAFNNTLADDNRPVTTVAREIISRQIERTNESPRSESPTAETFRALDAGLDNDALRPQTLPRVESLVRSGFERNNRQLEFAAALTALNPQSRVSEPLKMRAVEIVTDRMTTGTPQEKARASEAVLRVPTVFEQPVQTAATEFVARQMEPAREVTRPAAPTVDALRTVNTGLDHGIRMPAGSVEPMVRSGLESPNTDIRLQAARAAVNPAQTNPETRIRAVEVVRDALTQGTPQQQAEAGRIVLERPEAFTNVAAGNNNRPIEAVAREAMSSQVREAVRPDMAQAPTREALQALEVGAKDQQLRLQMPTGSIEPMVRSGLESPDNGLRMQAARTALSPNVQVAPEVKTRAVEIVTRELKQGTPQQQAEAGDVVLARPEAFNNTLADDNRPVTTVAREAVNRQVERVNLSSGAQDRMTPVLQALEFRLNHESSPEGRSELLKQGQRALTQALDAEDQPEARKIAERIALNFTPQERAQVGVNKDVTQAVVAQMEDQDPEVRLQAAITATKAGLTGEPLTRANDIINQKAEDLGGIDFNPALIKMEVNKENGGIQVKFDPKIIEEIRTQGIEGFVPVILNVQPLTNALPLLTKSTVTEPTMHLTKL